MRSLLDLLEQNKNLIIDNYHNKQDQFLIEKSLVLKLYSLSKDKNLIESTLREYLGLKQSDLVFYKKGFIFIKIVKEEQRKKITKQETGTRAERYNGISEEELEEFHKEFFLDEGRKDFFLMISQEFVQNYFHTNKITNLDYEKNVFKYIQNIVLQHLVKLYDNSDGFFTGFAGYLFRQNFKTVFEHIADSLLEAISLSNNSIIEFLNYYTSGIVVLDGIKYKVPSIEVENGNTLKIVSILPIIKVYFKAKHTLDELQKEIDKVSLELKKLYIGHKSPVAFNTNILNSIENIKVKIVTKTKKLKSRYDSIEETSNTTLRLQKKKEKNNLLLEIKKLNKEVDMLNNKIVQANVIKKYITLRSKMDSLVRHQKNQEQVLSQVESKFITVRDALVKALISKKKRV